MEGVQHTREANGGRKGKRKRGEDTQRQTNVKRHLAGACQVKHERVPCKGMKGKFTGFVNHQERRDFVELIGTEVAAPTVTAAGVVSHHLGEGGEFICTVVGQALVPLLPKLPELSNVPSCLRASEKLLRVQTDASVARGPGLEAGAFVRYFGIRDSQLNKDKGNSQLSLQSYNCAPQPDGEGVTKWMHKHHTIIGELHGLVRLGELVVGVVAPEAARAMQEAVSCFKSCNPGWEGVARPAGNMHTSGIVTRNFCDKIHEEEDKSTKANLGMTMVMYFGGATVMNFPEYKLRLRLEHGDQIIFNHRLLHCTEARPNNEGPDSYAVASYLKRSTLAAAKLPNLNQLQATAGQVDKWCKQP